MSATAAAPTVDLTTTTAVTATDDDLSQAPVAEQPAPRQHSAQTTHTFSVVSFVLGIVSIVSGWTLVAPITGLVLGIIALRRRTADRAITLWGVWLNAAMLAVGVVFVVVFLAMAWFGIFALSIVGA